MAAANGVACAASGTRTKSHTIKITTTQTTTQTPPHTAPGIDLLDPRAPGRYAAAAAEAPLRNIGNGLHGDGS